VNKLIIFFLCVSSSYALATCPNTVDNKKVMLFVDVNLGDLEIDAARAAACQRGERFEVVPQNYKEVTVFSDNITKLTAKQNACIKLHTLEKCGAENTAVEKAYSELRSYTEKQVPIKDQVAKKLAELNLEKVKLTNVSISGHDGGGSFGGYKGGFSRQDFASIMADYPEMNEVESLLLLGCYTGVRHEVFAWKAIFPKVKLIGGYDGSAPNSTRPQGHQYITDILTKEKKLTSLKNPAQIDSDVKNMLNGLNMLSAAIYLNPACEDNEDGFYYASKLNRKFEKFELNDCEKIVGEMSALSIEYQKYESGELEPPTDTGPNGALRKIYDKVRTHEHCLSQGNYAFESNSVFFLLFWEGLKKNFSEYYENDMLEAEKIIATIQPEEVIKNLEAKNLELQKQIEETEKQVAEYATDPTGVMKKYNEELASMQKSVDELYKSQEYQEIMKKINVGYATTNDQSVISPEEQKLLTDMNILSNKLMNLSGNNPSNGGLAFKVESLKYEMTRNSMSNEKIKNDPDFLKKMWVPTKANMANKSRKEILKNIHHMNGLLVGANALSPKQAGAVAFVTNTTENHLRYFQNPFSWHEFTGKAEVPQYALNLKHYIDPQAGGYVGGGMGGYSGGYNPQQQGQQMNQQGSQQIQQEQQPQH
jgi:hypothetical protein